MSNLAEALAAELHQHAAEVRKQAKALAGSYTEKEPGGRYIRRDLVIQFLVTENRRMAGLLVQIAQAEGVKLD